MGADRVGGLVYREVGLHVGGSSMGQHLLLIEDDEGLVDGAGWCPGVGGQ